MFKSWLISNIEFVFVFLYVILSLIFMNQIPVQEEGTSRFLILLIPAIVILFVAVGAADSGFLGSLIVGLIAIGIIVFGIWATFASLKENDSTFTLSIGGITAYFTISFAISVVVAVFAYKFFFDTVDMRWLYRNSDVSIYSEQWKYALNRFAVTLGGFTGIVLAFGVALLFINK